MDPNRPGTTIEREILAPLRSALERPLPGEAAHRAVLPPKGEVRTLPPGAEVQSAAVLLALHRNGSGLEVAFPLIRRPDSMLRHAGQVSLPGGMLDESETPEVCALREAFEEIGLAPNRRGQIDVDKSYQTALPHVYAVGDVAGPPSLASASYDQGRFVGAHIAHGECDWSLIEEFPAGIYTVPEISSLGRTERELTAQQVPYEVAHAPFKNIARAQITGHTVGMLKILFHRETLEILGIHCFGEQASEIIHIGQAIMSQKGPANTLQYFVETTFNYPTMAEAYRVAALNGLNRLF